MVVLVILIEWDCIRHFTRCGVYADVQLEYAQVFEYGSVEVGHRTRLERHSPLCPVDRLNHQLVINKIEIDFEGLAPVWNQRRAQPSCRHVEWNVP